MKPQRIQLSRHKGWRMPENTVTVARPGPWGNPFIVGKHGDAAYCVDLYKALLAGLLRVGRDPDVAALERTRQFVADNAGEVVACGSGFHACEHPLNVFSYYPPAHNRFAMVELGGKTQRKGDDTKIAAAEITIKAELKLPELIAAAIRFVTDRVKWVDGATTDGASEGVKSKKDRGAATASGQQGAATASGQQGAATASGYQGAATASGYEGKARGKEGCALFLVERSTSGDILHAWAGIVGRDSIMPDQFYRLVDGKPVEVE